MTNYNDQDSRDLPSPSVPPQTPRQTIDPQNRLAEQRNDEIAQRDREDSNAFGGLLLGMLLTALVGLGVAAYYFLNNQRPNNTTIIAPNPITSPSPQVKERIIERDRLVPVPQQSSAPAPNVNVTIPNPIPQQAPAARPAPAAQPAPEQRVPEAPAPVAPAGQ
ncbi:MAG: hypothetical protein DCF22_17710 [Leptolyngbya sp.]|nr:MAG: hypothetical protein DCF22_17710 [Leptolyngbya sp.]